MNRESIVVEAANGTAVCYLYYEDNETRRRLTGRMSKRQALWVADQIIRVPGWVEQERG